MIKIDGSGQLKVGDKIMIIGKNPKDSYPQITVKKVIFNGDDEEIIINKSKNYYFITKMMVEGKSWAKEVYNCTTKQSTYKVNKQTRTQIPKGADRVMANGEVKQVMTKSIDRFSKFSNRSEREKHVYPAANFILDNVDWLDEHDALEVSEALYNAGFLSPPNKAKELEK